jgi:predicted TIM-barrel fold metal-dependent hydrolase
MTTTHNLPRRGDLRRPSTAAGDERPGRRQFLAGLAAIGSGMLLPDTLWAQGDGARRIDVHHHFASPGWMKALAADNALNNAWKGWTPQKALDAMDKSGTQTAICSITTPGVWFGEGFGNGLEGKAKRTNAEANALARETNEYGARMVSDYKGRFGIFAALVLPDVDGSLKEIEYALDVLKLDGIGLMTSYGNKWVGDPSFAPIFQELNRRKALVYTHPTAAPCCRDLIPKVGPTVIEYNTDTTRTAISWIESGSATRFPDVNFIFSHAGGTLPYLVERYIGLPDSQDLKAPAAPNSKLYHLRRFYYDTAQSVNVVQMQALKTLVSAKQILFGTDFPYSTMVDHVEGIKRTGLFNAEELRAIDRENAARILPRFK